MQLPAQLRDALSVELRPFPEKDVARAAAELTASYRSERHSGALRRPVDRAAYLALRLPATYAALLRVFHEVRNRAPYAPIRSLLDLGAGPGTALWAAAEVFPELERATLLELDRELIATGQRLAGYASHDVARNAAWLQHDLTAPGALPAADLVVISYAMNELPRHQRSDAVARAWTATRELVVIVEPGTPAGFTNIIAARTALLAAGAHILAPCPHGEQCPMEARGDWCHFAARIERGATHRRLKQAELSYEDEKFSYVAVSRQPAQPALARIVRHPRHHKGHTELELCATAGLQRVVITRSDKETYRAARKVQWGDEWDDL